MADELKRLLATAHDDRVRDIFLCGGATGGLRDRVRVSLEEPGRRKLYGVFYPEEMFFDLLHGHDRKSLLDLEKYLASSVHVIAIIVESSGAIAELASFAVLESLTDKLVVFNDRKYAKSRSFINYGPIRKLQESVPKQVHYLDFEDTLVPDKIAKTIVGAANRHLSKPLDPKARLNLNDMSVVQDFVYLAIVVSGPTREVDIDQLVGIASGVKETRHITNAVLRNLQRHRLVFNSVRGWLPADVEGWVDAHKQSDTLRESMDELRLFALNLLLRKERVPSSAAQL